MSDEPAGVATAQAVAFPFYTAMMEEAERCRRLAREAIEEGSPVRAREWFEAAEAAYRAASPPAPSNFQTTITGPSSPQAPSSRPLGKDATCSYCGGALWVCRGVHNGCEEEWREIDPDGLVRADDPKALESAGLGHLRDDAPCQQCSVCGRKTWTRAEFGRPCEMPQPNGRRCPGVFR